MLVLNRIIVNYQQIVILFVTLQTTGFLTKVPEKYESSKSDSIITYLCTYRRLAELRRSLFYLFKNFNSKYYYPVVVFHRGDIIHHKAMRYLSRSLREDELAVVEFIKADFINEFPPGFNASDAVQKGVIFPNFFPNYQHMCAFWFRNIYLQQRLKQYNVKYYMRLDSDSVLLGKINYDLFHFVKENKIAYAYRTRDGENDCCAKKMMRFVYTYGKSKQLLQQFSPELSWMAKYEEFPPVNPFSDNPTGRQPSTYYANLVIVNVAAFRDDPQVWEFIDSVWNDTLLKIHGIYRYRWGDSPLRFQV